MGPSCNLNDIATAKMMLPLTQQSPIRVMADMIHRQLARELVEEKEGNDRQGSYGNLPICVAIEELQSTLGRHLVTKTPPSLNAQDSKIHTIHHITTEDAQILKLN